MSGQDGILIGIHYEYPFGGMATRPEWLPQGEEDWRRDLGMIKDTGFDSIRIRIGLDSSLDEVGSCWISARSWNWASYSVLQLST